MNKRQMLMIQNHDPTIFTKFRNFFLVLINILLLSAGLYFASKFLMDAQHYEKTAKAKKTNLENGLTRSIEGIKDKFETLLAFHGNIAYEKTVADKSDLLKRINKYNQAVLDSIPPNLGYKSYKDRNACNRFDFRTQYSEENINQNEKMQMYVVEDISYKSGGNNQGNSRFDPANLRNGAHPIKTELCHLLNKYHKYLKKDEARKDSNWHFISDLKDSGIDYYAINRWLVIERVNPSGTMEIYSPNDLEVAYIDFDDRDWLRTYKENSVSALERVDQDSPRSAKCFVTRPYRTKALMTSEPDYKVRTAICQRELTIDQYDDSGMKNGDQTKYKIYHAIDIRANKSILKYPEELKQVVQKTLDKNFEQIESKDQNEKNSFSRASLELYSYLTPFTQGKPGTVIIYLTVVVLMLLAFIRKVRFVMLISLYRNDTAGCMDNDELGIGVKPPAKLTNTKEFTRYPIQPIFLLLNFITNTVTRNSAPADANTEISANSNEHRVEWDRSTSIGMHQIHSWDLKVKCAIAIDLPASRFYIPLLVKRVKNLYVLYRRDIGIEFFPKSVLLPMLDTISLDQDSSRLQYALLHLMQSEYQGIYCVNYENYNRIYYRRPNDDVIQLRYGINSSLIGPALIKMSQFGHLNLVEKNPGKGNTDNTEKLLNELCSNLTNSQVRVDALMQAKHLIALEKRFDSRRADEVPVKEFIENWIGASTATRIIVFNEDDLATLKQSPNICSILNEIKRGHPGLKLVSLSSLLELQITDNEQDACALDFSILTVNGESDELLLKTKGLYIGKNYSTEKPTPFDNNIDQTSFIQHSSELVWIPAEIRIYRHILNTISNSRQANDDHQNICSLLTEDATQTLSPPVLELEYIDPNVS